MRPNLRQQITTLPFVFKYEEKACMKSIFPEGTIVNSNQTEMEKTSI